MPQRSFWTGEVPIGARWNYEIDPRNPEDSPTLLYQVLNQERCSMETGSVRVPFNVTHEAVSELLVATWEAYLFGEPGDGTQSMKAVLKRWKRESSRRPLWQ